MCSGWTEAVPLGRNATPDKTAAAVLALAWDKASYATGATLVAGGTTRVSRSALGVTKEEKPQRQHDDEDARDRNQRAHAVDQRY